MLTGLFQPMHLLIILIIVLIVFGPGKLPDVGKSLGRAIREFKSTMEEDLDKPELKEISEESKKSDGTKA